MQPSIPYRILDPNVIEDPYPMYEVLLRDAPVYQVPGTQVYLVSSWELIHEVLKNHEDYSANLTGILITDEHGEPRLFDFTQFGGTVDAIANADEPFHAVHRKLVLSQLNARSVSAMEGEVRAWARWGVGDLLAAGGGDCMGNLANAIPVMVMAKLVGLPVEDVNELLQWAFSGGDILAGTCDLQRLTALGESTGELRSYLERHFELAFNKPEPAAPQNIMDELVLGVRGGQISKQDAVAIDLVLVGAAGESTSSLVGSAIRILAQDAQLQQQLRGEPALIEQYVEEIVRLETPFKGHYRAVRNDTVLGGVTIPADARVLLLWAAANRDPAVFAAPAVLDITRPDNKAHLGFGHGIHFCIGARLARLECNIILQELLGSTASFKLDAQFPVRHVPSIFVRRLPALHILITN